MFQDRRVFVVLPCYNVEPQIADVIVSIPEYIDGIIAVDDASKDGTYTVLQQATDPRLTVIQHQKNTGVGGAMVTGFNKAAELDADIMVKVDGDGQMDLTYL